LGIFEIRVHKLRHLKMSRRAWGNYLMIRIRYITVLVSLILSNSIASAQSTPPADASESKDVSRISTSDDDTRIDLALIKVTPETIDALSKSQTPTAQDMLRMLFDHQPDLRDQLARSFAVKPSKENAVYYLRALRTDDMATLQQCLQALLQSGAAAPEKAQDYQAVIIAGLKLSTEKADPAIQLLKKWTGKELPKNSDAELSLAEYRTWYSEKFPNAPEAELPQEDLEKSKFSKQQLLDIAAKSPPGDIARGKLVFAKATCIKCHTFFKEGERVGPDLTSIRRRFQKQEIIESVLYPSQVISEQYQAVTISTSEGLIFSGMPLPNSGNEKQLVMLLSDATKVVVAKDKIEDRLPSRISVMPEGLFKNLSEQEIADLFAFLETSRSNPEPVTAAKP
jgi:putative heme-binding domain-containing protein